MRPVVLAGNARPVALVAAILLAGLGMATAGTVAPPGSGLASTSVVTAEGSDLAVDARLGGAPVAVAADGDRVLLATQSGLEVFQVREDDSLVPSGRPVSLPAFARAVALTGDEAYVGTSDGSVVAVDVSNPAALAVESVLDLPIEDGGGSVEALVVVGATLYATTTDRQLHTIDITARHAPTLVSSAGTGSRGRSVAVRDGIAYVVDQFGLSILDVSDRMHPVQLSYVDRPEYLASGEGRALALVGDRAYVGTPRDLRIIDIRDPRRARQAASVPVGADRLTVVGDRLFALDLFYGQHGGLQRAFLRSMELGQGEPPSVVENLEIASGPPAEAQAGGRWYLADGEVGLRAVVLDATEGVRVGKRVPPEHVALAATDGETLAVAVRLPAGRWNAPTARDRWRIDLAVPAAAAAPVVVGSWAVPETEGDVVALAVVGGRALVLTGAILDGEKRVLTPGFLHVLDIGTPREPVEVASGVPMGRAWRLHADRDWVLVGGSDGTVSVFAWTDAGGVAKRSNYDAGAGVLAFARHGPHALLATGAAFRVLDLSDPAAPRTVTVSGTDLATGRVARLAVMGDRLWAVFREDKGIVTENVLAVFDIGAVAAPRQLWRGETIYAPGEIAPGLPGELFIWSARGYYLAALDASGDGEPRQLYVLFPPAGLVKDVTVVGHHVHLAAGHGGYMRLTPRDPVQQPPTRTPVPTIVTPATPAPTPGPSTTPDSGTRRTVFLPVARRPELPPPALELEVLYRGGGSTGAVAVEGDRAYVVSGGRLVVLELAAPTQPVPLGEVDFPQQAELKRGNEVHVLQAAAGMVRALVAPVMPLELGWRGDGSFLVDFDCTDPRAPRTVSVVSVPGQAITMAALGRHVFVPVVRESPEGRVWVGIVVVHAPSSAAPAVVAEVETDALLLRLHAEGERLLGAGLDLGGVSGADSLTPQRLLLYDVSDRLHPVEIGRADIGDVGRTGRPVLLRPLVGGDVLFMGSGAAGFAIPCCEPAGLGRVVPVDLEPILALHGVAWPALGSAHLADHDLILVGDPTDGAMLAVLNLADPSAPFLRAIAEASDISGGRTWPTEWTALSGHRLVLSGLASGGARIVDLTDRAHPRPAGAWVVPGAIRDLVVVGRDLYTAGGAFERWDVTSPATPRRVASTWGVIPGGQRPFAVSGAHAFLVGPGRSSHALQVVRLDGPAAPRALATVEPVNGRPVPHGDRLYVADESAGLHVFALAPDRETGLRRLALAPPVGRSLNVAVEDDHAFVASGPRGLSILDVTDAGAWREVAWLDLPGQTLDVAVWESRAHVLVALPNREAWWADPTRGRMYTVDVSLPDAPRIVDWRAWPYVSVGYWRQHGSRLFVLGTLSSYSSGLCTIADLASGQPRVEGKLPGRWLAVDGSETGDLIYGVNEIGELVIGRMR